MGLFSSAKTKQKDKTYGIYTECTNCLELRDYDIGMGLNAIEELKKMKCNICDNVSLKRKCEDFMQDMLEKMTVEVNEERINSENLFDNLIQSNSVKTDKEVNK